MPIGLKSNISLHHASLTILVCSLLSLEHPATALKHFTLVNRLQFCKNRFLPRCLWMYFLTHINEEELKLLISMKHQVKLPLNSPQSHSNHPGLQSYTSVSCFLFRMPSIPINIIASTRNTTSFIITPFIIRIGVRQLHKNEDSPSFLVTI